jgi:hypothetical protein
MNLLAMTYGFGSPMKLGRREYEAPDSNQGSRMAGIIAVATMCAGGIVFYLRFLFAMLVERRRASVGMFVRLNTVADEDPTSHTQPQPSSTAQAA